MKESIILLNEQMDFISRIFEEGKIGSVIYNSYALVHQIATDALQELTEKDATIKNLEREAFANFRTGTSRGMEIQRLRKALEESVRLYETGDMESDFADILNCMYETLKAALGEGDKE